ncbi:uncharacterized protein LOC127079818 [Lathyrus oleraceus]|uniref:uncharacterized protein LOC127079818 n=1 Tax=Pisum sativum TaxID=3888 RepID=UPI0021D23A58|nr:uncharacterized protein LOC127079818 [Pisum sativum]
MFEEMFERVEHRPCLRHLYASFKKKFRGGMQIRDLIMATTMVTYIQSREAKMKQLKGVNVKDWKWLSKIPTKVWCKHAFSLYPKCDMLMNNVSEAHNNTILVARDKPILTLCEWIRNYIINRISSLRERVDRWKHKIIHIPRLKFDKEVEHVGNLIPNWSGEIIWKVKHVHTRHSFIVDISKRIHTCNLWKLVGIPYRHAISALGFRNQFLEDFVDDYYSNETYVICYNFNVSPINGQDMGPEVNIEEMLAPTYKRGLGRPKKLRRRELMKTLTREGHK